MAFAPLGDSSRVTISDSASVRTAIGTLPSVNGALRIIPLNPNQTALYIQTGDSSVVAAADASLRFPMGSMGNPIIIPIINGETHVAILPEGGSGDVLITRGATIPPLFTQLNDGNEEAITVSSQAFALPTLGTKSPAFAIVAKQGGMAALWVKLGTGGVSGSTTTSMKVLPGSKENPTIIGVTNSETHAAIFCEGSPGNVLIIPGDAVADQITIADIDSSSLSGSDATLITGTAGTDGNLAQWDANGDLVDGPDVLDEDDLASDSDTAVPTQQSVKAYVDALPSNDWTYATEVATTSGTAITLASGLPSTVREVEILMRGIGLSSANVELLIQLGDSGGFETAGYDSGTGANGGGLAESTAGFILTTVAFDDADIVQGVVRLCCYDDDNTSWNSVATITETSSGNASNIYIGSGYKELSAALTQIQITTEANSEAAGSQTFDAGTISLRYR